MGTCSLGFVLKEKLVVIQHEKRYDAGDIPVYL